MFRHSAICHAWLVLLQDSLDILESFETKSSYASSFTSAKIYHVMHYQTAV